MYSGSTYRMRPGINPCVSLPLRGTAPAYGVMEPEPTSIEIAVACVDLPAEHEGMPIYLAAQQGREVVNITLAKQRKADFTLEFRLGHRGKAPNFLGPYAQGPADERFFYLAWGKGMTPVMFGM